MASTKLPENMCLNAENQKEFQRQVVGFKKKTGALEEDESGVVYVGHIPHGFFESEMKAYFSQFGKVSRLRIARSKKTGGIKGYAFVEFRSSDVAKVVADTMDNYLMFNKLLKCRYLPPETVHPETFKGCNRIFKKPKAHIIAAERHNSTKTLMQQHKSRQRARKKLSRNANKLAEMGVKYDFPKHPKQRRIENELSIKAEVIKTEEVDDVHLLEERRRKSARGNVKPTPQSVGEEDVKPTTEEFMLLEQEKIHVLYEDSEDEEEIGFKTPPKSVRRRSSVMPVDADQLAGRHSQKMTKSKSAKKTLPKIPRQKKHQLEVSKEKTKKNQEVTMKRKLGLPKSRGISVSAAKLKKRQKISAKTTKKATRGNPGTKTRMIRNK